MTTQRAEIILTASDRSAGAFTSARRNLAALTDQAAGLRGRIAQIGPAIAGLAPLVGALALGRFIQSAAAGVDKLNDLSDATGASVEKLSALEGVGLRTGTSLDTVGSALVKFNAVLREAKPGSDAERVLQAIGLQAEELRRIDPADALQRVAVGLSRYADDGGKARAVSELFGKSVREVAPFLKDLAEQGQLNARVTAEQAAQAEQFGKQLFRLQDYVTQAGRSIAGELIPPINRFFDAIERFGGLKGAISARLGLDDQGQLEARAEATRAALGRTVDSIERLNEALSRDPGNQLLAGRLAKARERAAELTREAAAASEQLKRIADQLDPRKAPAGDGQAGSARPSLVIPQTPAAVPKLRPAGTPRALGAAPELLGPEVPESLTAALRAIESTDTAKVRELTAQLDRLVAIQAAPGGTRPEVAEAIDATRQAIDQLSPATRRAADEKARLDALLAATPEAALQRTLADMTLLEKAFNDGRISAEQYGAVVRGLVGDAPERLRDTRSAAEELGLTFSSALEQALVDFGSLRDVVRGLEQDLLRIVTRKLVTEPLGDYVTGLLKSFTAPAATGGGGGGGGLLSTVGTFLGSIFGGGRALGGDVSAGRLYRVNEQGPELLNVGSRQYLMMGSAAGNVIPAATSQSAAPRPLYVTNNFTVSAPVSRATQQQIAAQAGRAIQGALMRGT